MSFGVRLVQTFLGLGQGVSAARGRFGRETCVSTTLGSVSWTLHAGTAVVPITAGDLTDAADVAFDTLGLPALRGVVLSRSAFRLHFL